MGRKLATLVRVNDITKHPNADNLDICIIKGWKVVTRAGLIKKNDIVVFFEIDSFLPIAEWSNFLLKRSSIKKTIIDGKGEVEGIRLKTIKLRGVVSQGLVLPVSIIKDNFSFSVGMDVSETLDVYKYQRPIPANMAGEVKGAFPGFIIKTDEERVQNLPDYFEKYKNEIFVVTEKLDGTSATFYKKDGVGVCQRTLELKENEDNLYWRMAKPILETLPENFAIQGEIVGEGINGNKLKLKGHTFYAFYIQDLDTGGYFPYNSFKLWCVQNGIKTVPLISGSFRLDCTMEDIISMADGQSLLNPGRLREGLVFRLNNTEEVSYKISFKSISNKYLLENED